MSFIISVLFLQRESVSESEEASERLCGQIRWQLLFQKLWPCRATTINYQREHTGIMMALCVYVCVFVNVFIDLCIRTLASLTKVVLYMLILWFFWILSSNTMVVFKVPLEYYVESVVYE